MELIRYWKVIQKSFWLVLLVIAIGLASTAAYTLTQRSEYDSSATLLLNPSVPSSLVPYVQTQVAANLSDSYTQLIRTRSFGESVVKELSFPMSASSVGRAITTRLEPNTLFYRITARTDDPARAQELVKTVIKVFLSANAEQQQTETGSGAGSVKSELSKRLNDKLTYLNDQIRNYQTQISDLEKQPPSRDRDDQILQLRGQMVTLQQAETDAMVAVSQINESTLAPNTAITIDQPLPGVPVPSRLLVNLGLALSVSLLIGIGLAFLRDYIDYTVQSPAHLEEMLGVTAVAAVGMVGAPSGRMYGYGNRNKGSHKGPAKPVELAGRNLVALEHPKSPDAESFRVLRTNIQFATVGKPVHTLLVTSSGPGEGKSFTSSNLAVVVAQTGKRVILVDSDLRKPGLHRLFNLQNQIGFTNIVVDPTVSMDRVIQPIADVENLMVVTSGPIPPNPSELLNSQRALEVMEELAKRADMVIYDTPPAGVVTDPILLSTRVDAVVLVISANSTRRDIVTRVKQNLQKVGAGTILPVLNRVKAREMEGYYYYYHYYSADASEVSSNGHGPDKRSIAPAGLGGKDQAKVQVPGTHNSAETDERN